MRYVFAKSNQAAAAKKYALDRPDTLQLRRTNKLGNGGLGPPVKWR